MFIPRSIGRKKPARTTGSNGASGSPTDSLAPTPETTTAASSSSPSGGLPSTPAAAATDTTSSIAVQPQVSPALFGPVSSAPSKAAIKAAEQQQARTGRLARELALVLALILSDGFLAADAGPTGSGLELGKWLGRLTYLPLSTLLKHPLFHPLTLPLPPPAALAKAIRQYAPALDARLVLDEPRSFGGQRGQKDGSGGLEIGRRDSAIGSAGDSPLNAQDQLDKEVYVEYLPTQIHSAGALLSLFNAIFPEADDPSSGAQLLVGLSSPPYRNYCRLKFRSSAIAKQFLIDWSWTGAKDRATALASAPRTKTPVAADTGDADRDAAVKAGMRALSQAEFAKLEQEYLALLEARRPPPAPPSPIRAIPPHLSRMSVAASTAALESTAAPITPGEGIGASGGRMSRSWPEKLSAYPEGCVVFLRALDPATSKTTLKDAVNHLLGKVAPDRSDAVVSYVDWVKGADTAHVRLPHNSLSTGLLSQLASEPMFHLPLSAGAPYLSPPLANVASSTGSSLPLAAEVIRGERERLYWMAGAVREAGRAEAVRVSLAWDRIDTASGLGAGEAGEAADGGKRKAADDVGGPAPKKGARQD